ncbi:MAG: NTP transferase domain-containing protein [Actinobacteria bacterium]|nr:NTP transferase domain-containing protein [Actinomycetota bacterium]
MLAAVVLVGGRARRMGGAAKHLLDLGGCTPWERTLAALAEHGIAPVVAVGVPPPAADHAGAVTWVREEPPFGGPVAALAAALALPELAAADEILLLAGDLARPAAVVARLVEPDPAETETAETAAPDAAAPSADAPADAAAPVSADAVVFRAGGQPQWLVGRYRVAAVRAALAALDAVDGASCRALFGGLPIRWIADEDGSTADIDTPEDLARARAGIAGSIRRPEESS